MISAEDRAKIEDAFEIVMLYRALPPELQADMLRLVKRDDIGTPAWIADAEAFRARRDALGRGNAPVRSAS